MECSKKTLRLTDKHDYYSLEWLAIFAFAVPSTAYSENLKGLPNTSSAEN